METIMLSWNFFRPITLVRAPMFLVFHLICILLLLMKMNICYFIREKLEQRVTPPLYACHSSAFQLSSARSVYIKIINKNGINIVEKYNANNTTSLFVCLWFTVPVKGFKFWPIHVLGSHVHWAVRLTFYDKGHPFVMVISEDQGHSHLCRALSSGAVTTV